MFNNGKSQGRMARAMHAALTGSRGVASIEFGVIVPVLVIILLGTYDLGNVEQQRIRLADAVRAGAQYAMSFPTNQAGIKAAVAAALPASWTDVPAATITVAPATMMACPVSAVCPNGQSPELVMTLSLSRTYEPLSPFFSTFTLSADYVTRVQ